MGGSGRTGTRRRTRAGRAERWPVRTALDAFFFGYAGIAAIWLAALLLGETFLWGWGGILFFVAFWIVLAYLVLPRLHRILTTIYVPDYFIGRARTSDGLLGDPVNLALLGSEAALHRAMDAAGWTRADDITPASTWRIIAATLTRRSYDEAPVSPLFLFGRRQDLAYQQEFAGNPAKRHHVRFWRTPPGWLLPGGRRVDWLAAGTFDRAVGFSLFTLQITHKVDADIDIERDHIVSTLRPLPGVRVEVLADFSTGYHSRNGGGDSIRTDGDLPVIDLRAMDAGAPGRAAAPAPAPTPAPAAAPAGAAAAPHPGAFRATSSASAPVQVARNRNKWRSSAADEGAPDAAAPDEDAPDAGGSPDRGALDAVAADAVGPPHDAASGGAAAAPHPGAFRATSSASAPVQVAQNRNKWRSSAAEEGALDEGAPEEGAPDEGAPERGGAGEGALTASIGGKRVAFEPPAALVEDALVPPARRPGALAAGVWLIVLRVLAGIVWLVALALQWDRVLRDEAGAIVESLGPAEAAAASGLALAVVLVVGAVILLAEAVFAVLVWRGVDWARIVVMVVAALSITVFAVDYFAGGQDITLRTTLLTLALDILVLLALSSRASRAWSRP